MNPITVENEFQLYVSCAKGLLFSIPDEEERLLAVKWLQSLRKITDPQKKKVRNLYLKLLLLIIHKRRISWPFTEDPDTHSLDDFPEDANVHELFATLVAGDSARRRKEENDAPIQVDIGPDRVSLIAAQLIPNFGLQIFYAKGTRYIKQWKNSNKITFPRDLADEVKELAPPTSLLQEIERVKKQFAPPAFSQEVLPNEKCLQTGRSMREPSRPDASRGTRTPERKSGSSGRVPRAAAKQRKRSTTSPRATLDRIISEQPTFEGEFGVCPMGAETPRKRRGRMKSRSPGSFFSESDNVWDVTPPFSPGQIMSPIKFAPQPIMTRAGKRAYRTGVPGVVTRSPTAAMRRSVGRATRPFDPRVMAAKPIREVPEVISTSAFGRRSMGRSLPPFDPRKMAAAPILERPPGLDSTAFRRRSMQKPRRLFEKLPTVPYEEEPPSTPVRRPPIKRIQATPPAFSAFHRPPYRQHRPSEFGLGEDETWVSGPQFFQEHMLQALSPKVDQREIHKQARLQRANDIFEMSFPEDIDASLLEISGDGGVCPLSPTPRTPSLPISAESPFVYASPRTPTGQRIIDHHYMTPESAKNLSPYGALFWQRGTPAHVEKPEIYDRKFDPGLSPQLSPLVKGRRQPKRLPPMQGLKDLRRRIDFDVKSPVMLPESSLDRETMPDFESFDISSDFGSLLEQTSPSPGVCPAPGSAQQRRTPSSRLTSPIAAATTSPLTRLMGSPVCPRTPRTTARGSPRTPTAAARVSPRTPSSAMRASPRTPPLPGRISVGAARSPVSQVCPRSPRQTPTSMGKYTVMDISGPSTDVSSIDYASFQLPDVSGTESFMDQSEFSFAKSDIDEQQVSMGDFDLSPRLARRIFLPDTLQPHERTVRTSPQRPQQPQAPEQFEDACAIEQVSFPTSASERSGEIIEDKDDSWDTYSQSIVSSMSKSISQTEKDKLASMYQSVVNSLVDEAKESLAEKPATPSVATPAAKLPGVRLDFSLLEAEDDMLEPHAFMQYSPEKKLDLLQMSADAELQPALHPSPKAAKPKRFYEEQVEIPQAPILQDPFRKKSMPVEPEFQGLVDEFGTGFELIEAPEDISDVSSVCERPPIFPVAPMFMHEERDVSLPKSEFMTSVFEEGDLGDLTDIEDVSVDDAIVQELQRQRMEKTHVSQFYDPDLLGETIPSFASSVEDSQTEDLFAKTRIYEPTMHEESMPFMISADSFERSIDRSKASDVCPRTPPYSPGKYSISGKLGTPRTPKSRAAPPTTPRTPRTPRTPPSRGAAYRTPPSGILIPGTPQIKKPRTPLMQFSPIHMTPPKLVDPYKKPQMPVSPEMAALAEKFGEDLGVQEMVSPNVFEDISSIIEKEPVFAMAPDWMLEQKEGKLPEVDLVGQVFEETLPSMGEISASMDEDMVQELIRTRIEGMQAPCPFHLGEESLPSDVEDISDVIYEPHLYEPPILDESMPSSPAVAVDYERFGNAYKSYIETGHISQDEPDYQIIKALADLDASRRDATKRSQISHPSQDSSDWDTISMSIVSSLHETPAQQPQMPVYELEESVLEADDSLMYPKAFMQYSPEKKADILQMSGEVSLPPALIPSPQKPKPQRFFTEAVEIPAAPVLGDPYRKRSLPGDSQFQGLADEFGAGFGSVAAPGSLSDISSVCEKEPVYQYAPDWMIEQLEPTLPQPDFVGDILNLSVPEIEEDYEDVSVDDKIVHDLITTRMDADFSRVYETHIGEESFPSLADEQKYEADMSIPAISSTVGSLDLTKFANVYKRYQKTGDLPDSDPDARFIKSILEMDTSRPPESPGRQGSPRSPRTPTKYGRGSPQQRSPVTPVKRPKIVEGVFGLEMQPEHSLLEPMDFVRYSPEKRLDLLQMSPGLEGLTEALTPRTIPRKRTRLYQPVDIPTAPPLKDPYQRIVPAMPEFDDLINQYDAGVLSMDSPEAFSDISSVCEREAPFKIAPDFIHEGREAQLPEAEFAHELLEISTPYSEVGDYDQSASIDDEVMQDLLTSRMQGRTQMYETRIDEESLPTADDLSFASADSSRGVVCPRTSPKSRGSSRDWASIQKSKHLPGETVYDVSMPSDSTPGSFEISRFANAYKSYQQTGRLPEDDPDANFIRDILQMDVEQAAACARDSSGSAPMTPGRQTPTQFGRRSPSTRQSPIQARMSPASTKSPVQMGSPKSRQSPTQMGRRSPRTPQAQPRVPLMQFSPIHIPPPLEIRSPTMPVGPSVCPRISPRRSPEPLMQQIGGLTPPPELVEELRSSMTPEEISRVFGSQSQGMSRRSSPGRRSQEYVTNEVTENIEYQEGNVSIQSRQSDLMEVSRPSDLYEDSCELAEDLPEEEANYRWLDKMLE